MWDAWATQDVPLPLPHCENSCTFQGTCLSQGRSYSREPPFFDERTASHCMCFFGRAGGDCGEAVPAACVNGCSNRGRCLRGFCACDPGFFGIDCSIDLADTKNVSVRKTPPPAAPVRPPAPLRFGPERRRGPLLLPLRAYAPGGGGDGGPA